MCVYRTTTSHASIPTVVLGTFRYSWMGSGSLRERLPGKCLLLPIPALAHKQSTEPAQTGILPVCVGNCRASGGMTGFDEPFGDVSMRVCVKCVDKDDFFLSSDNPVHY